MLLLLQETNPAGGADPSLFPGCLCSGLAWWGFYLLTPVPFAGGRSAAARRDRPDWAGKGALGVSMGRSSLALQQRGFSFWPLKKNPGSLSEYWRALSKFPSASNKGCLLSLSPALQLLSAVTLMRSTLRVTPRLSLTRTGFGRNSGLWPPRLYPPARAAPHPGESPAGGRPLFSTHISRAELQGEGPRGWTGGGMGGTQRARSLGFHHAGDAICEAASRKHQESHDCVKSQLLFIFPSLTKMRAESFEHKGTARLFFFNDNFKNLCLVGRIFFFFEGH